MKTQSLCTACFDPVTLTMLGTLVGGLGAAGSRAACHIFGPKPSPAPTMPAAAPPVQAPGHPSGTNKTNRAQASSPQPQPRRPCNVRFQVAARPVAMTQLEIDTTS